MSCPFKNNTDDTCTQGCPLNSNNYNSTCDLRLLNKLPAILEEQKNLNDYMHKLLFKIDDCISTLEKLNKLLAEDTHSNLKEEPLILE